VVNECRTAEDLERLVAESVTRPVFLFKHSTRCPISASRWRAFQAYADGKREAAFYRVLVVEDRALSARIAQVTGIEHQSPQAILLYRGQAVWDASHWSITKDAMGDALSKALSS